MMNCRLYFAPMEGITGKPYRELHRQFFPGVDRYYTPFISPTENHRFTGRNLRELTLTDSDRAVTVPQLLTASAEDFLWAAESIAELGFSEVNLNLGCPSGTVVSKKKGAGFLANPDGVDRFLDAVFAKAPLPVSVKTRLGMRSPEEFVRLLEIYNRYPICELTVHPRTRVEFYKGPVHSDCFEQILREAKMPVCYNGNLFSAADCLRFAESHPQVSAIMVGRGLVANPQLAGMLAGASFDREALLRFHNALCENYCAEPGGKPTALPRMKEQWFYLYHFLELTDKEIKTLNKTTHWDEFFPLTQRYLRQASLREQPLEF